MVKTAKVSFIAIIVFFISVPAHLNAQVIPKSQKQAGRIFVSVTGLRVGIDDSRVIAMQKLIEAGKIEQAVELAIEDNAFYDVRLRNLAQAMSNQDETTKDDINDFVAYFVGSVRDELDARELLTGNYYYATDMDLLTNPSDFEYMSRNPPTHKDNMHFWRLQQKGFPLKGFLKKISPQYAMGEGANPDAAGLLTTRAFLTEHANDGTNRRVIEYTFKQFMCVEMTDWMDTTRPDDFVGRDVDRFAGGSTHRYQTSCKGCHSQLDAFRGAFAWVDAKRAINYTDGTVVRKFANNAAISPFGYKTVDRRWVNYATGAANSERFGWRSSSMSGEGAYEFGKMISESKGFSRCLAERFFTAVCTRSPSLEEKSVLRKIAEDFESTYKIKDLVKRLVTHPICFPDEA